jgi:orotidine-5'-phosphate decarboxylase
MEKKIALALDIHDLGEAKKILNEIEGTKIIIKIGYVLFIKGGKEFVKYIKNLGFEIFLDLKLHDIPNTVYNGIKSAIDLQVDYLTIHALGGKEMLQKSIEAKKGSNLKLLAVTILTSHSEEYIEYIGSKYTLQELAFKLAKTSIDIGVDGIVSSAHEIKYLKEKIDRDFIGVTPGIRLEKTQTDDQKRVATPEEAIKNGSDILVIGRPILKAKNKLKLIQDIYKIIKNVT